VKFYTCGFAFRGYTESQYWGPSSTRFSVNDADPLGGSTTIFTADNLPQNNDEQFFALRDV
jgi:hypothetical protein